MRYFKSYMEKKFSKIIHHITSNGHANYLAWLPFENPLHQICLPLKSAVKTLLQTQRLSLYIYCLHSSSRKSTFSINTPCISLQKRIQPSSLSSSHLQRLPSPSVCLLPTFASANCCRRPPSIPFFQLLSSQRPLLPASNIHLRTGDNLKRIGFEERGAKGIEAHEEEIPNKENELVLDGGFVVPEINSFGHTFRDYDAESHRQEAVENFYRINHINQTVEFVKRMREEYGKMDKVEMSIWECCELLNDVVDESDPDLDEPQIEHLLQTAEAIRKDYPDQDWLHLTGLIHDLGKVLLHPSFGQLPQWAVVGDTFPVGCAFDESIVHHKYFKENPDYENPAYNTKFGIYSEGCGLNNVLMSWGHDDYMYLVAKENNTTLPSTGLFIIRYHSFYVLHRAGAYKYLMNEEDIENLKWLQIFNNYDLYSKSKVRIDVEKVKPYYLSLIEKYFPAKLRW